MSKQELSLKVVPDNATHKGLVVTLSDKELASLTPTANGVELDARKGGTGTLTVESHHGEVTKTVPVNVGEANDILIDGTNGTGSRYVKDLPVENQIIKRLPVNVPYHRNGSSWESNVSKILTDTTVRFTVNAVGSVGSACYRPYSNTTAVLKENTQFTLAFDYNIKEGAHIWVRGYSVVKPVYLSGSGRAVLQLRTGTFTGGFDYLSFDACRYNGTSTTSAEIGDWFEISNLILVENTFSELPFYPAPEDYGVVHGQPNLLNGTSSNWVEYASFTGWFPTVNKNITLKIADYGWKAGDVLVLSTEIDNTNGTSSFRNELQVATDTAIQDWGVTSGVATTGQISKVITKATIREDSTRVIVKPLVKTESGTPSGIYKVRCEMLKLGTLAAMDEWTPSQSDSGLTVVNNGMVPFADKDYTNLLGKDTTVKSETKIVGRNANVDVEFKVLSVIEARNPELFTGLTTIAEKITKLKSLITKAYFVHSSRGAGISNLGTNKGTAINVARGYILPTDSTTSIWGLGNTNTTSSFVETGSILADTYIARMSSTGSFQFRISTLGTSSIDAVSDGITSAWVEVKNAQMEITIQPPENPNAKPITITVNPS